MPPNRYTRNRRTQRQVRADGRADHLATLERLDAPMPADPALMWVSVRGDRLFAARR